jgi:hypothetical protein
MMTSALTSTYLHACRFTSAPTSSSQAQARPTRARCRCWTACAAWPTPAGASRPPRMTLRCASSAAGRRCRRWCWQMVNGTCSCWSRHAIVCLVFRACSCESCLIDRMQTVPYSLSGHAAGCSVHTCATASDASCGACLQGGLTAASATWQWSGGAALQWAVPPPTSSGWPQ